MAHFTHLPPELHYAIIEYLDLPSLASLYHVFQAPSSSLNAVSAITTQLAEDMIYHYLRNGPPRIQFAIRNYSSPVSRFSIQTPRVCVRPRYRAPLKEMTSPWGQTKEKGYHTCSFFLFKNITTREYNQFPESRNHGIHMTIKATNLENRLCTMYLSGIHSANLSGTSLQIPLSNHNNNNGTYYPFYPFLELRYWENVGPGKLEDTSLTIPNDNGTILSRTLIQDQLLRGVWLHSDGSSSTPLPMEWFEEMGLGRVRCTVRMTLERNAELSRLWCACFRLGCMEVGFLGEGEGE
jgi:hypothetical protein